VISFDTIMPETADVELVKRNGARDSLFLVAQFRLAGKREKKAARIRNLSPGGLLAEIAGNIPIGTAIEIEVRGIGWVAGKIVWSICGRVGVAFDQQIDPILARKPVGQGTQTPGYAQAANIVRASRKR